MASYLWSPLYNNLINLTEDPTLPDLLPEEPMFNELLQMEDLTMPVPHPDVVELSRKLDNLTIESNTQSLRLEIEKTKRQRLSARLNVI